MTHKQTILKHMQIDPKQLDHRSVYKLLTGSIIPRPIAWVSSIGKDGVFNLAPYSFFTVMGSNPAHLIFCPGVVAEGQVKDSLQNVKDTGEFVVNIVNNDLAEAMNLSAVSLAPEQSEFDYARVEAAPSQRVSAPRVAASPVSFECVVKHIYEVGLQAGAGAAVIGEVVFIHVADDILLEDYKIDFRKLSAIGRLSGNAYTRIQDSFDIARPK